MIYPGALLGVDECGTPGGPCPVCVLCVCVCVRKCAVCLRVCLCLCVSSLPPPPLPPLPPLPSPHRNPRHHVVRHQQRLRPQPAARHQAQRQGHGAAQADAHRRRAAAVVRAHQQLRHGRAADGQAEDLLGRRARLQLAGLGGGAPFSVPAGFCARARLPACPPPSPPAERRPARGALQPGSAAASAPRPSTCPGALTRRPLAPPPLNPHAIGADDPAAAAAAAAAAPQANLGQPYFPERGLNNEGVFITVTPGENFPLPSAWGHSSWQTPLPGAGGGAPLPCVRRKGALCCAGNRGAPSPTAPPSPAPPPACPPPPLQRFSFEARGPAHGQPPAARRHMFRGAAPALHAAPAPGRGAAHPPRAHGPGREALEAIRRDACGTARPLVAALN
jgi:hypothetical protein